MFIRFECSLLKLRLYGHSGAPCSFIIQVLRCGDIIDRRHSSTQRELARSNLGNATCIMEYSTGFVDVQSSNNAIARRFSFPSSLKCPFCRQFLRALFDRLFFLPVIILPPWYIMQPSLWIRAFASESARTRRIRCNPILPETGSREFVQFFRADRDTSFSFFVSCSFPRYRDAPILRGRMRERRHPTRRCRCFIGESRRAAPWKFDIPA